MAKPRYTLELQPEDERRLGTLAAQLGTPRSHAVRKGLRLLELAVQGQGKGQQLALVDDDGRCVVRLVEL